MGSECVVDEGDLVGNRIVGNAFGRTDPADAAAIDLNVTNMAKIDEVLGHIEIMRSLAAGELEVFAATRKRAVGVEGARVKRLFQPTGTNLLESGEARRGGFDVFAENLAGIHEQNPVGPQTFTGGLKMIDIRFQAAFSNGAPAKFDRAEFVLAGALRKFQGVCRRIPEQLRGVRKFAISIAITE